MPAAEAVAAATLLAGEPGAEPAACRRKGEEVTGCGARVFMCLYVPVLRKLLKRVTEWLARYI